MCLAKHGQQIDRILSLCSDVQALAQPVFRKTQTCYFAYTRMTRNGDLYCLLSHPQWAELYFTNGYYLQDWHAEYFTGPLSPSTNITFVDEVNLTSVLSDSAQLARECGLTHPLLITHSQQNVVTIFHFAVSPTLQYSICNYLNSLNELQRFTQFFEREIHSSPRFSEILRMPMSIMTLRDNHHKKAFGAVSMPIVKLTAAQSTVLHWVAQGKSAEEISTILGNSPATIRKHIEHLKDKLDCIKLPNLIYKACQLGLL